MSVSGTILGLTPEGIKKLEKLKGELEGLNRAVQNSTGKNQYETEGLIRAFQDKETEIKRFLQNMGKQSEVL